MKHEEDEIPDQRDIAFAAANLRAWADHVEATGEGVRINVYSLSVSAPIEGAPGMAPLSEVGGIGWRHAPKLQHRNQGFRDHGSPWSKHHQHGRHPHLEPLDAPPPEPPCQLCGIDIRICRCDEDDLREALRELKLQIAQPTHAPRCYAVDDPATFPGDFGWPDVCNSSFWPSTKIVCPTSIDASFELAIERVARGESDGWRRWCTADPTTAANIDGRCVVDLLDELTYAADNHRPCPMCASATGPYHGWGLAGGGFGQYAGCTACGCSSSTASLMTTRR